MSRNHARAHFWRVDSIDPRRLEMSARIARHERQRVFFDDSPDIIAAFEIRLTRLNRICTRYRVAGYLT